MNNIQTVLHYFILFKYCLKTILLLLVKMRFCQILFVILFRKFLLFEYFENTVLLRLVNFVIHQFKYCFITVGIGSKNIFFVCVLINMQRIVCITLHACEIACNAPPSSTMARDFCVGLVYSDQQASIWPSYATIRF